MRVTDEMVRTAMVKLFSDGVPRTHWHEPVRAALEAALSHAAGQEVVAWILRTGHGTALHEGARPPVEGVGWRPLVIAPAVARSEGEG